MEEQLAKWLRISMEAYWEDNSPTEFKAILEQEAMRKFIAEELEFMLVDPEMYMDVYGWDILAWDMQEHFSAAYALFMADDINMQE